jgi:hypothetical protein
MTNINANIGLFAIRNPDCPSDAFATAASLAGSRVGWWQGAPSSRAPAWPWMAAAPVKAPESLAESQMRQLDNQVRNWKTSPYKNGTDVFSQKSVTQIFDGIVADYSVADQNTAWYGVSYNITLLGRIVFTHVIIT